MMYEMTGFKSQSLIYVFGTNEPRANPEYFLFVAEGGMGWGAGGASQ